jgi:hypothetical protein
MIAGAEALRIIQFNPSCNTCIRQARWLIAIHMISATATTSEAISSREIEQAACAQVERWLNFCDDVLDWHRERMLLGDPDSATMEEHGRTLKWVIRFTRMMHAEAADLDFPPRALAQRVAIRLRQLEDAWGTFHDSTLSPAEADRILAQVFPG